MDNLGYITEQQNGIIKTQSEIINELLSLLMQHISADEADGLPVVGKINGVAEIRRGLLYD